MKDAKVPEDIKKLSFEEALSELDSIVESLDQGSNKLDDAIIAYERGTFLRQHCEAKLKEAQERIDKINVGPSGELSTEPTEIK